MSTRSESASPSGLLWRSLCAALLLSLVAAACGGETEDDGDAPDTSEEVTAEATDDEATDQPDDDGGEEATPGAATAAAGDCQGAAELEGEQLEIAIPFSAGGGFDRQARIIADALSEEFGVTSVPVNETGAGGLVSLNQHATADPGALRIQYVQTPSSAAAQVAGAEGALFTLEEWPWLARVMVDPQLAVASAASGFESMEAVFGGDQLPRFAATGPGGVDYTHAIVLPAAFDAEANVVTGFGSTEEVVLSLAAGDVDVYVLSERALSSAVESGDAVPLALLAREESANLPDVPLVSELVEAGTEEAELVDNYINLLEIGRSFAAVPGADPALVETLSCMLETVLTDEEVVQVLEQEGDQVSYASGDAVQESVEQAVNAGGQFSELLAESF